MAGALILETWSDETLPSRDGGACTAGTERPSIESAMGETGIFGGGVGGTGELLGAPPWSDGHVVDDGMLRDGYRLRLAEELIESRVIGVIKLLGRVLAKDVQSSLASESSSVASYKSRSSSDFIWCCHSVSEHEEADPADRGENSRFDREDERFLVCSVKDCFGGTWLTFAGCCVSGGSSSLMVLSCVPRTCRGGGYRVADMSGTVFLLY